MKKFLNTIVDYPNTFLALGLVLIITGVAWTHPLSIILCGIGGYLTGASYRVIRDK